MSQTDRRMDKLTDRQRDRQTTYSGTSALCVASRGKNQAKYVEGLQSIN